jgi:hypothetical protein
VLRGLVATRQVHTISLGHAPHFYVAGTLPEFADPPTVYASSSMLSSAYFLRSRDHEEDAPEFEPPKSASPASPAPIELRNSAEPHPTRSSAARKPASSGKSTAARPHFSRPVTHSRDRKPAFAAANSTSSRPGRRTSIEPRTAGARPAGSRSASGSRPASGTRWSQNSPTSANEAHAGTGPANGARSNGSPTRPANGASGARATKSSAPGWGQRNGHGNSAKTAGKPGAPARGGSLSRVGSAKRKDARPDTRPARSSHKSALSAGTKAGNSKRFGFAVPPRQETKKRG